MKKIYLCVIAVLLMAFGAKAQTLLSESFNDGVLPAGWTVVDQDGDGYSWDYTTWLNPVYAHSGAACIASASYINSIGALHPQNWLISPVINIPSANTTLSWYAGALGYPEPLEVLVSTTGNTVADFTAPAIFSTSVTSNLTDEGYAFYTVDLSDYAGESIYIAFVHRNSYDNYWLFLDDVTIFAQPSSPVIDAAPMALSFGSVEIGYPAVSVTEVSGYNLTAAITATTAAPFEISTDGTTYAATATLAAAGGDLYVRYNPTVPGNDAGVVTLSSTGATDVTVNLSGNAYGCPPIDNFPFVETFLPTSENLDCWQIVDANNDGNTIEYMEVALGVYAGLYMYSPTVAANDWLISPKLVLGSNMSASFDYVTAGQYGPERYSVYVIGEGQTYENATNVVSMQQVSNNNWATQNIDLSAFANQTVRVAIKIQSAADKYWIAFTNFNVYDLSPHTISVVASDNNMGSVTGNGTFVAGTLDTLTATANSGYRFTGWSDGNTENPRFLTVLTDATYTAYFADLGDDTLQYDNGEFASSMGAGGTLYWGVRFNASELTDYNTLSAVQLYDMYAGTYDVRIYQGGTTAPGTQIYTESVTLTGSQNWFNAELSTPVTLDATQPLWVVIYNSGVTYPAAASHFVGNPDGSWVSLNGTTWAPIYSYGDYYLTWMLRAVLTQNTPSYTITATSADTTMGTVTGGGIYEEGTTATLTATANAGYHFVQWNDGNTDNPRTITVTEDATYTATFAANPLPTYTITATSADTTMGTVTGGGTYEEGATATLTAMANAGYHFVQWNDGNTDNPRTITVTEDATYTATFAANPLPTYTITATSADATMGTVTGGGTYEEGTTATLTATANAGYHFVQWNDGNTDNPRTITVTEDATYTATFAADPLPTYTITVISADETMGTVTGGGTFEEGTTITIEAMPNTDYEFVSWNDGNTDNPRQITVIEDQTFVATFQSTVSVDDVDMNDVAVYSHHNQIVVDNAEGYAVEIYNLAGQLLVSESANAQSHRIYPMGSNGIYLVRVGQSLLKKVVITK